MDNERFLGYMRWSEAKRKKDLILHQRFVTNERQRQGIGTMILRHWAEEVRVSLCRKIRSGAAERKILGRSSEARLHQLNRGNTEWRRCYYVHGL